MHPVRLIVNDDLRRSRLTVFFRLLLAIPLWIWLSLWAIPASLALLVNWLVTLVTGRSPDALWSFLVRFLRFSTHVSAYLALVADPYPPFTGRPGAYPVDLEVDGPPEHQNRWITGFRVVAAIPAALITNVLQQVMQLIAFLGWFACLALGRMPEGMRNLNAYCLRYQAQTYAYLFVLTDRYPSLSSSPGTIEAPSAPSPAAQA